MKVAISKGYGAGWSTWGESAVAFDPVLIEALETDIDKDSFEKLCYELGYTNVCMHGYEGLCVEEVPAGMYFQINEYDGHEWIELFDPNKWILAK